MSGGFGRARWGSGPWGGSDRQVSVHAPSPFAGSLYHVPRGVHFGRAAIPRFTGEPTSGPLSGASGLLFFSAALLAPSSSNSIDVAGVSAVLISADSYVRPPERSSRLFRFGGGPGFGTSNPSRTGSPLYRTQPLEYTAVATMTQTIPPGPTTVIKIP